MKMSDILAKINARSKYSELAEQPKEVQDMVNDFGLLSQIWDFAADTAELAELKFGLTSHQGDLVYNSVANALKYLKNYPKE